MSIVLQSSGGGQITVQEPATASNFTQTLPAASGTVVLAGTTPTFNGITFPATQSASADANTLDDYEEGTWTPVFNRATGGAITASVTIDSATYVKIGKSVILSAALTINSVTSQGSGLNFITGLPFMPLINYGSAGALFRNTVFTTDVGVSCAAWSDGKLYFHNTTNTDSEINVAWKTGRLNFTLNYEA